LWNYIDIVAVGTVADIVPLVDENRIIVKKAFETMPSTNNKGLKALLDVIGYTSDQKITSSTIGYRIGPRLNAAGRLGDAKRGVRLFTTDNNDEAQKIAKELDGENANRQQLEAEILEQAIEMIEKNIDIENTKVIVIKNENWHHGVIGIVSSRITEKYYRPSIILCVEDELTTILTMESEINTFYSEHSSYLKALDSAEGIMHLANKIVLYKNKINNLIKFSILIHDYDSSLITYFGACLKYINKSLEYVLDQNILLVKKDIEFEWKLNLRHYHVQDEFIEVYDELSKMNISTVPYRKIVLGEYDSQGNILKNIYDIYSEI